jgi:hypothetical protein
MDPQDHVQKIISAYGGHKAFFGKMDMRLAEFNEIWNQDSERIGRVLRAHLSVEYFMTDYIRAANPNLGAIDGAKLTFYQKVELLDETLPLVSQIKPGLKRLNTIRNRVAHNLKVDVQPEDKQLFLSITLFSAMKLEKEKSFGPEPDDPLSIVEQFARFVAGLLHAGADPDRTLWEKGLE